MANMYDMRTVPPMENVEMVDLKAKEPAEKQDAELTEDSSPSYSLSANYPIPSLSTIHTTV